MIKQKNYIDIVNQFNWMDLFFNFFNGYIIHHWMMIIYIELVRVIYQKWDKMYKI